MLFSCVYHFFFVILQSKISNAMRSRKPVLLSTMRKHILFLLSVLCLPFQLRAENIGVPAECEDVMLQAFYWDSYKSDKYGRTKWIDLLKDTAAINANFDLVWFPPSASSSGGVGYYHACLSKQDSDWGTKTKLQQLIYALHEAGTKVIGDIVINHRGNKSNWCDFWADDFTTSYGGKFQLTSEHICSGDECFTKTESTCYNSSDRGAADTGTNDAGARDLDHSSEYVQSWAKAYLKWMMGYMKYDGFRYDMTLGYAGKYLGMYNETAQPYISVSEFWEGIDKQVSHLKATDYNTMVFDFPMKYQLHQAIVQGSYGKLKKNTNSLRGKNLARYAVTFIDNHDTFERDSYGSNQFGGQNCNLANSTTKSQVLQAHAYILMMPGIPCVFWPHWVSYKDEINQLIAIRKKAGIHSESEVIEEASAQYAYSATVQGHRGKVVVRVGKNRDMTIPAGFSLALNGDAYSVYLEEGMAIDRVEQDRTTSNAAESRKFLRNGHMLIHRAGAIYDLTGRKVNEE